MINSEEHETQSNPSKKQHSARPLHIRKSRLVLLLLVTIILTALIAVAATLGFQHWRSGLDKHQRQSLSKVENVYQTLTNDYYKKKDPDKLSKAAIDGMVKELDDPYSEYMTKDQTKSFNEDVSGDFVGIGAEMQKKDKHVQITSPMKGSPAEKAGLKPKDIVKKVDGKSVKGQPLEAIVKKVRGKKGSTVTLTIQRGTHEQDFKIKRDKIHVKSVDYSKHGSVAVLKINKFQSSTSGELKSALLKAHKAGINKVVLDLRNNPGGLLDEAVKMINVFVDKNKTAVELQKGDHTENIKTSNNALKEAQDMDVSILINEGSASASEVFTGAMRDYNKATIYGSKSFGKGIVQTTHEFKDGSLLKFTNMKWLTPKGHYIHKKGIQPDHTIKPPKYQQLSVIPTDKTLKVGDNNQHVSTIKIGLNALGYHTDDESKTFDSNLERQVKAFQKDHHLDETGAFDKSTNEKFTQALVDKSNKHDTVLDDLLHKLQ